MLMYCVMRRQMNKGNEIQLISLPTSQEQQTTPPQQQTVTTGPVYEEVSQPKEEIELKTQTKLMDLLDSSLVSESDVMVLDNSLIFKLLFACMEST